MFLKYCTQYASKFGKLSSGHRTGKGQKGDSKECSNYCTIALISHARKVMLKILQARFQKYMNRELRDVHDGFRTSRGTRDQTVNICWIIEKPREFYYFYQEKSTSSLTTLKPLTLWITTNYGKFLKRWDYQTTLPTSFETCMQVRKQQLEPDMEQQQTGSNLGKEYVKAIYCHLAYLTYMPSISCKMPATWHKAQVGIKIAGRNINNLRYADDTTLIAESKEELKSLCMKVKED